MLERLRIKDLAIISDLEIEFRPALNVITGETGAGKSILLGALGLLLGERARGDVVRTGCERAQLQAVFDVGDDERVGRFLAEADIAPDPEGALVLRREVMRAGKSRCQINDTWVGVQTLAALGELLADFHGQHQHQSLLRPEEQLLVLDEFGRRHKGLLDRYTAAWREFTQARAALERLDTNDRERVRRLDLLRYELDEIESAGIRPGEYAELDAEMRRLANAEKLSARAADAYRLIYEADQGERSAVDLLGEAEAALRSIATMDPGAPKLGEPLAEATALLEELAFALRDYAAAAEGDPERLDAAQERLELLKKLRRKYGEDEAEILALAEEHRREIDAAYNAEAERARLTAAMEAARKNVAALAADLTAARAATAKKIAKAVERELAELNMRGARFEVRLPPLAEPGPHGAEDVEFYLSANPGEEARPLRKVASGGELSRIMLALKTVDAQQRRLPMMVFDEIDTGIGGLAAERVGEKLRALAARQQVLCITHLGAIAALGDRHLHVSKGKRGRRTESHVEPLEDEARLAEIARMIGGAKAGPESLAAAKALIEANGAQLKSAPKSTPKNAPKGAPKDAPKNAKSGAKKKRSSGARR